MKPEIETGNREQPSGQFPVANSALVLEGGGMRGAFTAGVLDSFMDRGIRFPYMVGVSGGTNNGISYWSNQRGRSYHAHIPLMESHRYIGLKAWRNTGSIINMDLLYGEFAEKIYPYDFDAAFANPTRFEMVATHCLTGEALYLHERSNPRRLLDAARASASLPILSPPVMVDGIPMTDGGVSDSIPLAHAFSQGFNHAVVVLTQNRGFRKRSIPVLPRFVLRDYPKVREMLHSRPQRYNTQLEWVEQEEQKGRIVVIRPIRPLEVGRLTSHLGRLQRLYDEGYELASQVKP